MRSTKRASGSWVGIAAAAVLAFGLAAPASALPVPAPTWLAYGPITQYPSAGGTWQYGFWNAQVRSYYTVNKSHRSTVNLNGNVERSICTASGRQSKADLYAIQSPNHDDRYYYSSSC